MGAITVFSAASPVRADEAKPLFRATFDACYRTPALASLDGGVLIAVVEKRYGYPDLVAAAAKKSDLHHKIARCSDSGSIDLVARLSSDGGKTWSPERTIVDHRDLLAPNFSKALAGNPTLVRRGGEILLLFSVNRSVSGENSVRCVRFGQKDRQHCDAQADHALYITRSGDGGATWAKPEIMNFPGKSTRLKQPGPGHGLTLESGRIVVPAYPKLLLSDDDGRTWREGATTQGRDTELQGGETVIGSLGGNRIWASLRPRGAAFVERGDGRPYRIQAVSADGGETYETVTTDERLSIPPLQPGLSIAGDTWVMTHPVSDNPTNGRAKSRDRKDMTLSVSQDSGRTWSSCLIDPKAAGYSDLAKIAPKLLGMLYEGAVEPGENYRAAVNFRTLPIDRYRDVCVVDR
ncbi:exo-alpha-sialidase [Methylopila henanensis]|uniref:exo-alpha-sialidase n=1 Tax=Methylopila henanensis TaxID=873516 RepID=A0ABW4K4E8_9HYPH